MSLVPQVVPKIPCNRFNPRIVAIHLLLLAAASFCSYQNNFEHSFNLDDTYGLLENPFVRSLSNIPRYFVDPMTLTAYRSNSDYRPVLQATFALNYWISKYDTWSWHLTQILLHLIVVIGLYLLCLEMNSFSEQPRPMRWLWFAPLWIGIVAAVHPTSSGVINYFWARSSLLVAAFLMPAFVVYLRSRRQNKSAFWALALYGMALFSKVEAVAGIAVFVLLEALIYRRESIDMRVGLVANLFEVFKRIRRTPLLWFFGLTVIYFCIRAAVMPDFAEEMRHDAEVTPYVYFCTQMTAWWFYLWKWIAPFGLVADNTTYPIFRSFWDSEVMISAGAWLIAASAVMKLWRTRPDLAFFAMAAFVIISPTSSIAPISEMVNEHRPYLPMALASVVWITLIFETMEGKGRDRNLALKLVSGVGMVVMTASFMNLTRQRNLVFKTNKSYSEDIVQKAPSARSYLNYGLTFLKDGDYQKAKNLFDQSAKLAPNWFIAFINLGITHDALEDPERAMIHYDRAVELERVTTLGLQYRAAAWEKRQKTELAISDLRMAVQRSPTDCQALQKLGETLQRAQLSIQEVEDHRYKCN